MEVEAVAPVGIDVLVEGGRQVNEVVVADRVTLPAQLVDGRRHVDGVPGDHGVRDQVEAGGLVGLVVEMTPAQLPPWAKNKKRRRACTDSLLLS